MNTVNHILLLEKLKSIGFGHHILTWLNSFLSDRTQCVRINNYISYTISAYSGVPQGSHCGPLLFNLFVNDIPSIIHNSKSLMFADDLKIFRTVQSTEDCHLLQLDINSLYNWSRLNGIELNINKCFSVSFTKSSDILVYEYNINDVVLKNVTEIKDLGVIFDRHVTFNSHINTLTQKGFKNLGFINRYCKDFSHVTFKILFCSLVRSGLEYASAVWSPYYFSHINDIEKVQNKFLRNCAFKLGLLNDHVTYTDISDMLNLKSLEIRRLHQDLLFLFKLLTNNIDCENLLCLINFNTCRRTRNSSMFYLMHHSTNYGLHSPLTRMQRNFDYFKLDASVNLSVFRNQVRTLKVPR